MTTAVDVRDVLPWSLIYGAQNARHDAEVHVLDFRVQALHAAALSLARELLWGMFAAPVRDWQDAGSPLWRRQWCACYMYVTEADIDAVAYEYVQYFDSMPYVVQHTRTRADMLKNLLAMLT